MAFLDRNRIFSAAIAAMLTLSAAVATYAAPDQADLVKAATMFKLAKYVSWPEEALAEADKFVVGILAGDDMTEAIETAFDGKTMNDLEVEIVVAESGEDLMDCHLVYIGEDEQDQDLLDALAERPVLSFGDGADFAKNGGTVGLFLKDKKMRFDISLKGARAAGLTISSKVLELATHVHGSASAE